MRLIGELNDSELAKKFAAYLLTKGITPQIDKEGDLWEIWVKEEDHLQTAVGELEEFTQQPHDERYANALEQADEIAREQERKRRQFQKNVVKVNQRSTTGRRAPLTILLIVISSLVALATNFGLSERLDQNVVFRALSFTCISAPESRDLVATTGYDDVRVRTASLQRGEVWRLITPIFIHFGAIHIVFNMIWLFQFGHMIENRYGTFLMAVLVLVTGALSNLIQGTVPENLGGSAPFLFADSGYLLMMFGGMSGVVYGLFGFIWVKSTNDPASGFRLPQSTIIILVGWLFACMFFFDNIANWAHAVGLVVGMVSGYMPNLPGNMNRKSS